MKKYIHVRHHTNKYYVILVLLFVIGFLAFMQVSGNPWKQFEIGALIAITYVGWGVFHHMMDETLNWKVVVEYSAISMCGLTLFGILLFFT